MWAAHVRLRAQAAKRSVTFQGEVFASGCGKVAVLNEGSVIVLTFLAYQMALSSVGTAEALISAEFTPKKYTVVLPYTLVVEVLCIPGTCRP